MSLDLTDWHAGRYAGAPKPRWSPRCAVCGEALGRDVTLDVISERDGGRFRLTCMRRDPAHAAGVSRHYELSADHAPSQTIEHVAEKAWVDPERVAAAVIEWVFAYRLIQETPS
jgi:hypothetical protein